MELWNPRYMDFPAYEPLEDDEWFEEVPDEGYARLGKTYRHGKYKVVIRRK